MAIKRILVIVGVLLLAFTSFSFGGGKTAVIDSSALSQISAHHAPYNESCSALVNSLEPSSHLDKKRKLRVRYMKAEVGNITPAFSRLSELPWFPDTVTESFYSCIFYSENHKLHKLRGPPSFVIIG